MNSIEAARRLADDINARLDCSSTLTVSAETIALYQSMARETLGILRAAFIADRDQNPFRSHCVAFCQSRIDLIDRLLAEREKETGRR